MARLLLERIAYGIAVLFAVISLTFVLIHLSGDPLAGLVPPGASPEQEAIIRAHFGLDRPLPVQYVTYLGHAVQGDFGDSWRAQRPAMEITLERLPATLRLAGLALVMALAVSVPLGLFAGSRPGQAVDVFASALAVAGQAIPAFWLGTILIALFAVRLQWLPASGGDEPGSVLLPSFALALYPAAVICRLLRSSTLESYDQDFVRTARGKGLSESRVLRSHVTRNAALPALAFAGVQVGFLLGGAVVVEGVFAYPGIGQLALNAVADRDLPVIQAVTIVVAVGIVLTNLLVDAIAGWFDPRQRAGAMTAEAWS